MARKIEHKKTTPTREVSLIRLAPSLQILSAVVLFSFSFGISALLLFLGQGMLLDEVRDFLTPDKRIELEGTVQSLRAISYFGALIPFILILVWIAIADRTFIRPIADLLRGVEQVARGNFSVSIAVRGRYGVGTLIKRFNDMTLRLQAMRKREKEISRTKSEVISIVSHQLQTPLTETKWAVSSLLDGDTDGITTQQKETLARVLDSNEDMMRLVHNLLNVTRIEQDRFGYTFKDTDMQSVVKRVVDGFGGQARKRDIDFKLTSPRDFGVVLHIDEERIALALGNLIENALLYTPSGGSVRVQIREGKAGGVQISVKDTGIGIPASDTARIFAKFFRAPNAVRMRPGGSGLGLFIVKNIIARHGGRVWAESEEGKGSTFFIALPLSRGDVPK